MKDVTHIDNRIARLQALMKRLRAERRVAVLRDKHWRIKFNVNSKQNPYSEEAAK
jgi:uncharacterized small protein (DUF1192 family)